jgi:hypothetical protein
LYHLSIILALSGLRQKELKFQARLGYRVRPCLKKKALEPYVLVLSHLAIAYSRPLSLRCVLPFTLKKKKKKKTKRERKEGRKEARKEERDKGTKSSELKIKIKLNTLCFKKLNHFLIKRMQ